MTGIDEPLLDPEKRAQEMGTTMSPHVVEQIRQLVSEEPYGVLCTQSHGQPYGSMIAVAFTADLGGAVFATSRFTRKYQLLSDCDRVALVLNNREKYPDSLHHIEAITATGRAQEIANASENDPSVALLLHKHPMLKSFILAPSTAVFHVSITRYFHVHRFQEVREWRPQPQRNADSASTDPTAS
ncbi:MAG: pyridoxamine 5'-phosphate oxidase family protein [candidate division Zixibacteria bacterium]|nr:pyridoxamine 5'-phosphate oxidase family protein [candidate division Zixibacteria bacterium]